jgi:serine/threonine-protein kinase
MWDNRPYLVMEYIVGDPIDHWCDARRLPVASRIALFLDVLDAVAHAHTQTVVHGNFKPANILVTASGRVKVLDLGVARMLEHASSGTGAALSHVARRVFTPVYTAPEQFEGDEVTPAADIYGLGVLLHTLLVGAHPGARRLRSLREPPQRMAGEIALLESAPLSASSAALEITHSTAARRGSTPEQLARGLRGGLGRTIAKAIKPRPCERYRTTEAFAGRLRPYGLRPSHGGCRSFLGKIMRTLLTPD